MAKKKTPTKLQLLKGVDKKNPNRVNKSEPKAGGIGEPPKHFKSVVMKRIWNEIIDDVADGVFQSSDRVALELAVTLLYEFRRDPLKFGTMKMNRLTSLLASFGMTPSDRSKIVVPDAGDDNPFSVFD